MPGSVLGAGLIQKSRSLKPAGSPDPWAKALLARGSFALSLVVAEVAVRIIDPLPYFSRAEINNTEHGNLSQYDPLLGWRGVPNGAAEMVTENQRVWLQNNSQGFRDIEHDPHSQKPAIVFLGDSFAWGYDVEFDLIAASLVRRRLPDFEVFDLAHRGNGTDQSLLTFRQWQYDGPLRWVVLMFFENDVVDNNALVRYKKPKPRFELIDGEMQLHRRNSGREPNHVHVAEICRELNISTIEFAPALEASWLRVYYRFRRRALERPGPSYRCRRHLRTPPNA